MQTCDGHFTAGFFAEATGRTTAVGVGETDDVAGSDVIDDRGDIILGIVGAGGIPDIADETETALEREPAFEADEISFVSDPVLEAEESPRLKTPNSPSRSGCNAAFRASLARTSAS